MAEKEKNIKSNNMNKKQDIAGAIVNDGKKSEKTMPKDTAATPLLEKNAVQTDTAPKTTATTTTASANKSTGANNKSANFPRKTFKKNIHPRRKRPVRPKSEFDQKIIKIRRVTRVVSGGRRFSFSVAMVLGNRKGSVGVGVAKASDTALAIEKAIRKAKKTLIKLKLTDNDSIPYDVSAKYCSSLVQIIPAKLGKGLSAGSSVKTVLELAGITDVTAKIISRSKNKLNNAMTTLRALEDFKIKN